MSGNSFVIGIDYGTDSVRALIVNTQTGEVVASSVSFYKRWQDGLYCDPSRNQFRQHPLDYIEGLEECVKNCLTEGGSLVSKNIKALSMDTTGSTPAIVDKSGHPLALQENFSRNPDAMFVLWKDHTAIQEAGEINAHTDKLNSDYLKYVGGIYSSEWFWAKLLHLLRNNNEVREAGFSCVEHCDWMPFLLTGGNDALKIKRGVCAAGHKALWAEEFNGFPPDDFFSSLDPLLTGYSPRLSATVYPASETAGKISGEWASRLGLPGDVLIGIGALDAHMGAVGGQIEPYHLSKVIGTSTCDMLVVPREEFKDTLVKGICGQVDGSIIPGMIGLEAGQSAFGDTYSWFKRLLLWPIQQSQFKSNSVKQNDINNFENSIGQQLLNELGRLAGSLPMEEEAELSIDWFNGRRTPDANQQLKGAITGLGLGSDAPRIYRSLVEATCFGAKKINERFQEEGINIKGLIGVGSVAKVPYVMQVLTNILGMPIRVPSAEQPCALGAAMFAATLTSEYPKVESAMEVLGAGFSDIYQPEKPVADLYAKRYQRYKQLSKSIENLS